MSFVENKRQQIFLLIAISLAGLMDGLDGSVVNIALPVIASDFGSDTGTVAWVTIMYLLIVAGTILIFGNIASRGHLKKTFIAGFAIFTAASILCGFSPSLEILIAARAIQGLGAAMIIACAPLICVTFLPGKMLGVSFALLTAASSIGFAIGPAIGGIITYALSWHWIFFINIPIGIFAILFAWRVVPKGSAEKLQRFDVIGALLFFAAMVCATFALERFPHMGFSDPAILISAGIGLLTAVLFIIREGKTPHPLMNLKVFTSWKVDAVFIAFLIIQVVFLGIFYLLPFYLTAGAGFNTLISGIFLLIPAILTAIISVPFGRWSDRLGRRRRFTVAACCLLIAVNVIYAVLVPGWGAVPLVIVLILMGFAMGIASGPAASRLIELMPPADREMGSSLMMTCCYAGGVVGTALYAAIFTILTSSNGVVLSFAELDMTVFMTGFHLTMMAGVVLAVAGTILNAIVADPPAA